MPPVAVSLPGLQALLAAVLDHIRSNLGFDIPIFGPGPEHHRSFGPRDPAAVRTENWHTMPLGASGSVETGEEATMTCGIPSGPPISGLESDDLIRVAARIEPRAT